MYFEIHFKNDLKRLRYKKYQVCELLGITMPTLKTKIENPNNWKWGEIHKLKKLGFEIIAHLEQTTN